MAQNKTKVTLLLLLLFSNSKLTQFMCTANIRFPVYFSKFVSRISCFEYVFPFTKSLEFMSQEKFYSPSWNNKTTYKIMFCKQWDQWSLCGGKTFRGTWENLQCLKEREIQEEISRLSWKAKTEIPENQRHIEVSGLCPAKERELPTWRMSQNL